ncbi:hypothetical protein VDGL01_01833 [Verticillium dahliae]
MGTESAHVDHHQPNRLDRPPSVDSQDQGVFSVFRITEPAANHDPFDIQALTGKQSVNVREEHELPGRTPTSDWRYLSPPEAVSVASLGRRAQSTDDLHAHDASVVVTTSVNPQRSGHMQPDALNSPSPSGFYSSNIEADGANFLGASINDEASHGEANSIRHGMPLSSLPRPRRPSSVSTIWQAQASNNASDTRPMPINYLGHPSRALDIFPSSSQRALISHWVLHLSHKWMPIRTPTNPYLTVLSPIALEGSRMANSNSSSTAALFHAVCAASATHQAVLRGDELENNVLVLQHRRQSYFHLMRNMHRAEPSERLASFGTLCLWIMTQFISGTPGTWREVVKVTRSLLEDTRIEMWTESTSASITYQSYAGFLALIQSRYVGYVEVPSPLAIDYAGHGFLQDQGLSSKLLSLISSFNTILLSGGAVDVGELDQLEMEFALSTPPVSDHTTTEAEEQASLRHQGFLFYHACLLYFKCVSGRRGSEADIDALMAKCIQLIERLDATNEDQNPSTWIYATVAFEARTMNMRDRLRASIARRVALGFETWNVLQSAAEEIWKSRDGAPTNTAPEPWPHMLARMPQFDLLLF